MSQIFADIQNGRIYLSSDRRHTELCRQIFGSRWNKNAQQWHFPITWAVCKQLRSLFHQNLIIGPELLKWAEKELDIRITPSLELRESLSTNDVENLPPGLYKFQQAGVRWLLSSKNSLLSDEVGAGKTIQVLAAAQILNALPMLVICPASMRRTWAREAEKWWPGVTVCLVEGTAAKRKQILESSVDTPFIMVINWEAVRLHSRLSPFGSISLSESEKEPKQLNQIPFKLVVADEAHRLKDPLSKQCRATWAIAHSPSVQHRWALTGTPLTNAPDTLFPILHFLDPNEWPSKTKFIERYCMWGFNTWGAREVFGIRPETREEFESIFHPRFRRMPKEVILPQLPPIIYEQRYVEMNSKQRKAYETMAESLFAEDENGNMIIAKNPISQLTRLTQYASAYVEMTEDGPKLSNPSCKLDQLMIDLDDFLNKDNGVVVFAQSRQLIRMASDRLTKAGIEHGIIEGGQTPDIRQNAIDNFQFKKIDVLLVVIAAGGSGLTLNRARVGIFLQRSWSLVDQQQAIGRIHRIGSEQHENIVVINYITSGTIEEHQLEILENKFELFEEIVRDRKALVRLVQGNDN